MENPVGLRANDKFPPSILKIWLYRFIISYRHIIMIINEKTFRSFLSERLLSLWSSSVIHSSILPCLMVWRDSKHELFVMELSLMSTEQSILRKSQCNHMEVDKMKEKRIERSEKSRYPPEVRYLTEKAKSNLFIN